MNLHPHWNRETRTDNRQSSGMAGDPRRRGGVETMQEIYDSRFRASSGEWWTIVHCDSLDGISNFLFDSGQKFLGFLVQLRPG